MDDFGIEKFNSSVPGNYEKGNWTFAYQSKEETRLGPEITYTQVDFDELALSDPSVKDLDDQSRQLKLQSNKSNQAVQSLNNCKKLESQTANLKKLDCPIEAANRGVLANFVKRAGALGVSLPSIPSRSSMKSNGFAELQATDVVRTNIDGTFTITNPPEGAFLLHAIYRDNFNEVEWLVPVSGDATSIELNNSNSS